MPGRIETGGNQIRNLEWAVAFHDFVPTAWNSGVKQAKRDERASNHNRSLDEIGPDDGLDSTERGVNRRENDDGNGGADVNPKRLGLAGRAPLIIS